MKFNFLISLFTLTLFTSCSSYMNSVYRDFEQQERSNSDIDVAQDSFEQFRKPNRRTSSEYNKPGRTDKSVTTANQKIMMPDTKRQYKPEKESIKRYTASDLTDNGNDGSLWAGSDPNAFMFTNNKNKNSGDIIQINVLSKLKNEITLELKRAFPDNPYETRAATGEEKSDGKDKDKKEDKEKTVEKREPATVADTGGDSAKDKISGVVVEEINREHLLIKGRKNVLFKNRKRMVEVQALVSRKDIGEDDSISSDAILETNISVVR